MPEIVSDSLPFTVVITKILVYSKIKYHYSIKKILITIATLFLTSISFAETIQCRVVDVNDGDTITCLTNENKQIKVRLWGIDAPENDQDFGQNARQALSALVYDKEVWVENKDINDKNKIVLGVIRWHACSPKATMPICHLAGKPVLSDINFEMIRKGYTWYHQFDGENPYYQRAEQEARETKLGLWAETNPIPPWKWRKQKVKK